jgi:acetyltransferase
MALEQVIRDPQVDLAIPILVPQALINPVAVAEEVLRVSRGVDKPVVACFMGDQAVSEARKVLHAGGVPMYVYPENTGRVLGAMRRYGEWRRKPPFASLEGGSQSDDRPTGHLPTLPNSGAMGEAQTRPLLEEYNIPVVQGAWVRSAKEAGAAAEAIGGSVVLKIVSPDLIHKSDAGGIRLGLHGKSETAEAYVQMMEEISEKAPAARLEGAMVEAMAPHGQEVIIGMRRDPSFGPMIMFGLGGIYVELFADVAFRIAPISEEEARDMILETRAGKLLFGFRGTPQADIGAVVKVIRLLGQLALDLPQISEIEINPLIVYPQGQGVLALDCRAIL